MTEKNKENILKYGNKENYEKQNNEGKKTKDKRERNRNDKNGWKIDRKKKRERKRTALDMEEKQKWKRVRWWTMEGRKNKRQTGNDMNDNEWKNRQKIKAEKENSFEIWKKKKKS